MGKQAEKKIELAKKILDLEDADMLRSVDELVNGGPFKLSKAELEEVKAIRDQHLKGKGSSDSWPNVKKRMQALVSDRKKK
ncbi:MAG: hypothetical protein M3R08_09010 [Bacteroidota bacterium]|nr:hypothetical protein [Bacteroidota bacterium]